MTELLDANRMSSILGIKPPTLRLWVKTKRLPCVRLSSNRLRFDPDEVMVWLKNHNRQTEAVNGAD